MQNFNIDKKNVRQHANMQGRGDFFQGGFNQGNQFLTAQNARADIIGELEAIIQYEAHLQETDDPTAKATITDIVNEEKLHVGQLFGLLFKLDPISQTQFEKGYNEFVDDDEQNSY